MCIDAEATWQSSLLLDMLQRSDSCPMRVGIPRTLPARGLAGSCMEVHASLAQGGRSHYRSCRGAQRGACVGHVHTRLGSQWWGIKTIIAATYDIYIYMGMDNIDMIRYVSISLPLSIHINIYIYLSICVYLFACILHIYIYIERERERNRERDLYIHLCIHSYIYIYVYNIYKYI